MLWVLVEAEAFDPSELVEDEITWTRTWDGTYLAKSAYDMQFDRGLDSSL
jgi:hypothetical protein